MDLRRAIHAPLALIYNVTIETTEKVEKTPSIHNIDRQILQKT